MKGAGVQFAATGARQAAQTDSLLEFADNQRRARDWSLDEVWRLAAGAGWVGDTQVLLRTWQDRSPASAAASRNALERYAAWTRGAQL